MRSSKPLKTPGTASTSGVKRRELFQTASALVAESPQET